jgi:hypothetical protein
VEWPEGCRIRGRTCPKLKYHGLQRYSTYSVKEIHFCSVVECDTHCLGGGHNQLGSLAGAAHLLNVNADVLRLTPREQKSLVDQKGKSQLDSDFQCEYELRKHGLSIL